MFFLGAGFAAAPLFLVSTAAAGTFSPQVGQAGAVAVENTSPTIRGWATGVSSLTRGRQDKSNVNSPLASFGVASDAVGPASGFPTNVVSLGDGGSITLTFATPIGNGPGADFAVFENGFLSGAEGMGYLELGFVEVSSDGLNFTRFAAVSQTQTATQVGGFETLDATNLNNLAGKHIAGFGTPFDLAELTGTAGLNTSAISHVRIVDVVGSVTPIVGSRDSLNNLINDPFTTDFASSGFDLDGVAVINVPEPTLLGAVALAGLGALRRRRA